MIFKNLKLGGSKIKLLVKKMLGNFTCEIADSEESNISVGSTQPFIHLQMIRPPEEREMFENRPTPWFRYAVKRVVSVL